MDALNESKASAVRAYGRYLVVAAGVGLVTVGLREVLGLLSASVPGHYAWTMVLAYGVGVVLSYLAQARFTFGATGHTPSPIGLANFAVLAILSALLTAMTAYMLRYGLSLEALLPTLAAPLAFAVAALLVAPVGFLLGRQLVFGKGTQPAMGVRDPWWICLVLLALVVGQCALFAQVTLRYKANAGHDEALFLQLAQNLVDGSWLGAYSATTLIKGPGFPLWLAAVHILQVPVSWAAALTYAFSCVLVFFALRPLVHSAWQRLCVFAPLLLSPVALSDFSVLRELIYPSLTLAVVACGIGLALRIEQLGQRIAPWCWAAGLGLSSALFALTREESIWLLPLWVGVALRAIWIGRCGNARYSTLFAATALTALFCALPALVVASQNRFHYGVFTILEVNSRPFVSAYSALVRVRHTEAQSQVPFPREEWHRVALISPAFAEVRERLESGIGDTWVRATPSVTRLGAGMDADPNFKRKVLDLLQPTLPTSGLGGADLLRFLYQNEPAVRKRIESYFGGAENAERFFHAENEIGGGWFVWALRDGVTAAGHHVNAVEASGFYQRLADEVNAACDQRKLQCDAERNTLRPPFHPSQLAPLGIGLIQAAGVLMDLPGLSTGAPTGPLGERSGLTTAESFLHESLAASLTTSPPVEPLETLIDSYRNVLPWISGIAMAVWLLSTPLPRRRQTTARQRTLWLLGALLMTLVGVRLALIALIHVTSWPSLDVRYIAPAQPLLVLFDTISLLLLMEAYRPHSPAGLAPQTA